MKVKYFAVAKLPTIFILGTYLPYMVLAMAYSFSQLQSFQDCPLKYRFEKVDKIGTPSLPALPLMLGSAVHSALEQLYAQRRLLVIPSEDMVV
ncbi:MAG: PD-(D/E)XK nuclease family protein [bacterium]